MWLNFNGNFQAPGIRCLFFVFSSFSVPFLFLSLARSDGGHWRSGRSQGTANVNGGYLIILSGVSFRVLYTLFYYYLCQRLRAFLEDRSQNWNWIDSSTSRLFMIFYSLRDFISLKCGKWFTHRIGFLAFCRMDCSFRTPHRALNGHKSIEFGLLSPWKWRNKKQSVFIGVCCGIRQSHQKYAIIGLFPRVARR